MTQGGGAQGGGKCHPPPPPPLNTALDSVGRKWMCMYVYVYVYVCLIVFTCCRLALSPELKES